MRNKLKLSPKTKTTVSVKKTLVYASVGVGMFLLIFTGAFFYLNMGSSEEVIAEVPATTTKVIVNNGRWSDPLTWSGGIPEDNDIVEIPKDFTLILDVNINNALKSVTIKVYGIFNFANGKLSLDADSKILVADTGDLRSISGNNDKLEIGGYKIKGNEITAIPSPAEVTLGGWEENNLLPIVLDYFTAQVTATNFVLVEWGTVSEKENDFFTLERSSDGKTFEEITTAEGAGNSLKKLQYSFEDNKSTVGMNYYRLKQTDFNGDFEYFKIVGVNNKIGSSTATNSTSAGLETIKIGDAYPNPFKSVVNLSFEAEIDGEVEILIQNARGEIVHKEFVSFYYGKNDYQFTKGDQLQSGIYYINVWSNGRKFQPQRLIKM